MTVAVEAAPLHQTSPDFAWTFGDLAAGTGADLGLEPDAEQRWLLDQMYGEKAPGIPAAYEVCVVAPRQNLKSAVLEIAALHDLYVVGVPLAVWTAHEFKTARKSFEDMRRRILRNPDYAARTEFRDSHGEEAIYLDTGERLEFHARSGGSGRGFTCSRLTLDEAMFLQEGDLGALGPTMFTIPDAQVRYGSSAGKVKSSALRDLRRRGRAGDDALAYAEYGAPRRDCPQGCPHFVGTPGCALDDRDLWWWANCALWAGRATLESVARQRKMLPPREFMREFLSWWEDPPNPDGGAIDLTAWGNLAAPDAPMGASPVFGVDVDADRLANVAVVWPRDGVTFGEVACDPVPAHELAARVRGIAGDFPVAAPTAVKDELERAGCRVVEIKSSVWAQASSAVLDAVRGGSLRHGNQALLNEAARVVKLGRPSTSGARPFVLQDSNGAGPIFALTRALHALSDARDRPGSFVSF